MCGEILPNGWERDQVSWKEVSEEGILSWAWKSRWCGRRSHDGKRNWFWECVVTSRSGILHLNRSCYWTNSWSWLENKMKMKSLSSFHSVFFPYIRCVKPCPSARYPSPRDIPHVQIIAVLSWPVLLQPACVKKSWQLRMPRFGEFFQRRGGREDYIAI